MASGCVSPPVDYFKSALDLDKRERYAEAIVEYTRAIELRPDATAILNRGQDYMRMLQFDLAIADFTKAIEMNPIDAFAYLQRGIAYINKGFRDATMYALAIADFTKSIDLNPDDAKLYDNRGYAYALSGQYVLAAADLNNAIRLSKDPATTEHAQRILAQIQQPGSVVPPPATTPPATKSLGQTVPADAQVWEITENENGQVVRVLVDAGVFNETSDSPGWWIKDGVGNRMYKLPVNGNIFRNSPGDTWRFVNFGNAGGGFQTLGGGEGTANGNFPAATTVTGTMKITTQSPLGSTSGSGTWSGKRVK